MGQAKQRGDFHTRLAQAKEAQRIDAEKRHQAMLEAEANMTHEQKQKRLEAAKATALLINMSGPDGWDYLTQAFDYQKQEIPIIPSR
jgi:uncharacterized protein YaiL (DUF2058 family)